MIKLYSLANNLFMLKSFPKLLTILFLFHLACLLFLTLAPSISRAADIKFTPQVQVGNYSFDSKDASTGNIARYIRAVYKYAIGIVGILAAVVLMIGGVIWVVAGGSATMIGEAKAWIGAALTGLTLALLSYLVLATVNPALVDLKTAGIQKVGPPPTAKSFDVSVDCGQQVSGQNIICGSKCPDGQKCEKVPEEIIGAKKCPADTIGRGDYYLCSSLSGGGTYCCNDNNNEQCQLKSKDYVCNMKINTGFCPRDKGTCALKQALNGVCGENDDCISNKCDTGFLATYRCQ